MDARYLVIEIRTNDDGTISNTATSFAPTERNQAENKYHSVLAAAAISAKPIHAAVLMTAEGHMLDAKCYYHETAPTEGE